MLWVSDSLLIVSIGDDVVTTFIVRLGNDATGMNLPSGALHINCTILFASETTGCVLTNCWNCPVVIILDVPCSESKMLVLPGGLIGDNMLIIGDTLCDCSG